VVVVVCHRGGGGGGGGGGRTEAVTITRGEVTANPRSCFVTTCARV